MYLRVILSLLLLITSTAGSGKPLLPVDTTSPRATMQSFITLTKEAAEMQAPIRSRVASARNKVQQRRNELARERADLMDRIKLLKTETEAALKALQIHVDDIDAEDALYANGFQGKANVEPIRQDLGEAA